MLSARTLLVASVLGLLPVPQLSPLKGAALETASTPRVESAPCPAPAKPIQALQTARCGYLIVPENRSKSGSRTIRLAMAVVPTASGKPLPDPIVFMAGGPGESAI